MKTIITLILLLLVSGCAGTGFEKKTTLVPDSITIGVMQEKYRNDPDAWKGVTISGTWTFK